MQVAKPAGETMSVKQPDTSQTADVTRVQDQTVKQQYDESLEESKSIPLNRVRDVFDETYDSPKKKFQPTADSSDVESLLGKRNRMMKDPSETSDEEIRQKLLSNNEVSTCANDQTSNPKKREQKAAEKTDRRDRSEKDQMQCLKANFFAMIRRYNSNEDKKRLWHSDDIERITNKMN